MSHMIVTSVDISQDPAEPPSNSSSYLCSPSRFIAIEQEGYEKSLPTSCIRHKSDECEDTT